jgi:hypothetical protein
MINARCPLRPGVLGNKWPVRSACEWIRIKLQKRSHAEVSMVGGAYGSGGPTLLVRRPPPTWAGGPGFGSACQWGCRLT